MKKSALYFLIIFLSLSCKNQGEESKKERPSVSEEQIIEMNKYLVEKDDELISSYAKRRGWEMDKTGTGLWYMIYEKGSGEQVKPGDLVKINYKIELLDGTVCYTSDYLGPKVFRVGKGQVVKGLEEGILLMHEGGKARFIMPPHLAHHLLGDENKIPSRATIVYYVDLLKISKN